MTLYAKVSSTDNGYDSDIQQIKVLDKNKYYEVEYIDMGSGYTSVVLKGIRESFNSVNLSFYKSNLSYIEHDIFSDPYYNPYL